MAPATSHPRAGHGRRGDPPGGDAGHDAAPARAARERGFALLLVLWSLVLLAMLGTRVASAGRVEARLAGNLREAASTQAAADGAVYEAVFRVMTGGWLASGRHEVVHGGIAVQLDLANLAGRINPNVADPPLMAALIEQLGIAPRQAAALADAIADWRSPGARPRPNGAKAAEYQQAGLPYGPPSSPFGSVAEIGAVLGMTPALMAALRPHLSVWWQEDPNPALADPVVRRAWRAAGNDEEAPGEDAHRAQSVVDIVAVASGPGGRSVRHAVVQIAPAARVGNPWRVLEWSAGPDPG